MHIYIYIYIYVNNKVLAKAIGVCGRPALA